MQATKISASDSFERGMDRLSSSNHSNAVTAVRGYTSRKTGPFSRIFNVLLRLLRLLRKSSAGQSLTRDVTVD